MKKVLFLLFSTILPPSAMAQESQTVMNFLRLPVSSHAAALGGENISLIEDDASLAFQNPALLGSVTDKTLHLGYMNYMSGVNMGSASYAFTKGDKATFAIGAQYLNYGSMKQTTADGEMLGTFTPMDISFNATVSYVLAKQLVGGITFKYIYSDIAGYKSTAACADLGLNYYLDENDLSLSFVVKNLGGQLTAYNEDYERMPTDVQLGFTKRFPNFPFRVSATAVDLAHWNYSFERHLVLGADLMLGDDMYLSIGYNFRRAYELKTYDGTDADDKGSTHGAGLSLGGGITFGRMKLNAAYAIYHVASKGTIQLNINYQL